MQKVDKLKFYEGLISTSYIEQTAETKVKFNLKRIQQKYNQLVFKYRDRITREEILGFCIDILQDMSESEFKNKKYIHIAENKTMKNGKLGYNDDITKIIFRLDRRINDKIDGWLGAYEIMEDGVVTQYSPMFCESLETELNPDQSQQDDDPDAPKTIGDMATDRTNIFHDEQSIYTNEELDERLRKIYKKAKLTDREIEVLQTLEKTQDNEKRQIYNKKIAGKELGCTGQNISNIFNRAKKKIKKTYKMETRHDKVIEIDNFLDNINDGKDIINYILENREKEMINYILYDSDLDSELVRYFNKNNEMLNAEYNTYQMKKFCTYFLKELYTYKELIEFNIKMQKSPNRQQKKRGKWDCKIDKDIYIYVAENKLEDTQKKGEYIIVDSLKYYLVSSEEQKEQKKTRKEYKKQTFLKK